jgi:hypothetical protein
MSDQSGKSGRSRKTGQSAKTGQTAKSGQSAKSGHSGKSSPPLKRERKRVDAPRVGDPASIRAARKELHELAILSAALVRLATRVHERCEELRESLGDTAPLEQTGLDELVNGAPVAEPGNGHAEAEQDPAALLAMTLAGQGHTRDEIASYLESRFGMEDADELLDRVLPRP